MFNLCLVGHVMSRHDMSWPGPNPFLIFEMFEPNQKMTHMKIRISYFLFLSFFLLACSSATEDAGESSEPEVVETPPIEEDQATSLIRQAIEQHGGDLYDHAFIEFDFRDRHYTSRRNNGGFTYERIFTEEGNNIRDVLSNGGFHREINGERVALSAKDSSAYSNSVNSVLYFVQLPYFLLDPAVNRTYLGETTIKGEPYHEVKVTFAQEGGGKDFEDEFVYWIHRDNYTIGYLAYNYLTDGGGARFREAYNIRMVEGIRFADYINYKPEDDAREVAEFDSLFEAGKMTEVSRIDSENIQVEVLN